MDRCFSEIYVNLVDGYFEGTFPSELHCFESEFSCSCLYVSLVNKKIRYSRSCRDCMEIGSGMDRYNVLPNLGFFVISIYCV